MLCLILFSLYWAFAVSLLELSVFLRSAAEQKGKAGHSSIHSFKKQFLTEAAVFLSSHQESIF